MSAKDDAVKVIVAMSGGVDSSVAATLLKEKDYQVSGVTMKIWDGKSLFTEGRRHSCYGPGEAADIEDAQRVARTLGIDFFILDLKQDYRNEVLDYFGHEYLRGRTPNPCLRCNQKVKFDALLRKAQNSGIEFDYFATGHYARVEYDKSQQRYLLKKARDLHKDQSYFIAFLSQEQLSRCLFPIGDYTKEEVRKIAAHFGLGLDDKPESQDFVSGGYTSLLETAPAGPIMDKEGNILGEHQGISFYTIGQRKRLGISTREPRYVIDIDQDENAITVGSKEELYRDELIASQLNWIAIEKLEQPIKVSAKIRQTHQEAEATVIPIDEGQVKVKFSQPQMAITPGQAVVLYQDDVVIGSGTIERRKGEQYG